jgi:hypothetical protein
MAGTATAVTSGDAIPLLDDNGSGQYIKGRNNARDIRVGLLGALWQVDTDGFTTRPGIIAQPTDAGSLFVSGQVSPNQTVLIRKGRAIVVRSGQGAYVFVSEQDQTVNMPAASGANFRTDVVCAAVGDLANFGTDAAHGPFWWVEQGALGGGVPVTPTGMVKLAEVFRAANDNTISSEVVDKRSVTGLFGAINLMAGGDLALPGTNWGQLRDTGSAIERWTGAVWQPIQDYGPGKLLGRVRRTSNLVYTNTETIGDGVTLTPRTGRQYKIELTCGSYGGNNSPSAIQGRFRSVAGTGPITAGSTLRGQFIMPVPNGLSQGGTWSTITDASELGTAQITVGYSVQGTAGNTSGSLIGSAANHETTFSVTDVT